MTPRKNGHAGAATVNITPERPVSGYFGNVFGRGDPGADILAHALVLTDGSEIVAFVAADVVAISARRPAFLLQARHACHGGTVQSPAGAC